MDRCGSECDRELAERIYDECRADDQICFDKQGGLVIRDGVDFLATTAVMIND